MRSQGQWQGRVKRQQREADDGWTVVTRRLPDSKIGTNREQWIDSYPAQVAEGLTSEKLLDDFAELQERWKSTALAQQIKKLIGERNWDVRNAVCIGIGSFSRDWAHRWRSLWQLVLFIATTEELNHGNLERKEPKVMSWAQDPAFTSLDIDFLGLLNVEITGSEIQRHVGETSYVYSPFVDWYLLLPTFLSSPSANPVLYVGNEILADYTLYAQTENRQKKLAECNKLGRGFLEHREMVKLEEFDLHAQALNGMVVYWRTESDVEKETRDDEKP